MCYRNPVEITHAPEFRGIKGPGLDPDPETIWRFTSLSGVPKYDVLILTLRKSRLFEVRAGLLRFPYTSP